MTLPSERDGGERAPKADSAIGMRRGIVLREALPWAQCVEMVKAAEATGYESVFVPEIVGREAFSTLAGFAADTQNILLGTGVVTIWSRNPFVTGMAAATVQDLSSGRLVLGIGTGTPAGPAQNQMFLDLGPLYLIQEYVRVVRQTLLREPIKQSKFFGVARSQLVFPSEVPAPPIWMGALNVRMIKLAGEVADGVLLNWCTPERVAKAKEYVRVGAERANRDPAAVTVAVYVRACVGVDEGEALLALQEMTGQYATIPHYFRQFGRMGFLGERAAAADAVYEGRPNDVPEQLVRAVCVLGDAAAARMRLQEYADAGADVVLCYPVATRDAYSSVMATLRALAPDSSLPA